MLQATSHSEVLAALELKEQQQGGGANWSGNGSRIGVGSEGAERKCGCKAEVMGLLVQDWGRVGSEYEALKSQAS